MKIFLVTILILAMAVAARPQGRIAHLTVKLNSLKDADSLILQTEKYGDMEMNESVRWENHSAPIKNRISAFDIPITNYPVRFHLILSDRERKNYKNRIRSFLILSTQNFYLEKGDRILLTEIDDKLSYSGRGSDKLALADSLRRMAELFMVAPRLQSFSKIKEFLNNQDSILLVRIKTIDAAGHVSAAMKTKFKIEAVSDFDYRYFQFEDMLTKNPLLADSLLAFRRKEKIPVDTSILNHSQLIKYSAAYAAGLARMYMLDSVVLVHQPLNVRNGYNYFKTHYKGDIRELLVTYWLNSNKRSTERIMNLAQDALSYVTETDFRLMLLTLYNRAKMVGAIYQFNLSDTSGNKISLSRFKGKVLLIDFWFTGCGPCRETAPVMSKLEDQFAGKPVVFLSVNMDKALSNWKKSLKSKLYSSDKAINLYTQGQGEYHPITKYFNLNGAPNILLFSMEGNYIEVPEFARRDGGKKVSTLIQSQL